MALHYVTFGQSHTHRVNGKIFDCDTVAVYEATNSKEGRQKAFEYFGDKFFTDYTENQWTEDKMEYFPKGYVHL